MMTDKYQRREDKWRKRQRQKLMRGNRRIFLRDFLNRKRRAEIRIMTLKERGE